MIPGHGHVGGVPLVWARTTLAARGVGALRLAAVETARVVAAVVVSVLRARIERWNVVANVVVWNTAGHRVMSLERSKLLRHKTIALERQNIGDLMSQIRLNGP